MSFQKFCFPDLKVWREHNKSLRDLVQTFLRWGQITIYLPVTRRKEGHISFFLKHMAALLETVPEP